MADENILTAEISPRAALTMSTNKFHTRSTARRIVPTNARSAPVFSVMLEVSLFADIAATLGFLVLALKAL
jgi:hypothetical protein